MSRDITFCQPSCERLECGRNCRNLPPGRYSFAPLSGTELCPNCASYYRHIPDEFKRKITKAFAMDFIRDLCVRFEIEEFDDDAVVNIPSTIGWFRSFEKSCNGHNLSDLLEYERELEWYDSDHFDSEITELCIGLIKYGLHF